MKNRSVLPMWIAKDGYIVISALFCLAGILMIFRPDISLTAIGTFLGITLLIFGVIRLIGFFSKDLFRLAFQYDFQFGVVFIVLGLVTLIRPDATLSTLCIFLGICVLLDSLFKIRIAMEAKNFGVKEWWMTLGLALLNCLMAVILIFRPVSGARIMVRLLGAALILEGGLNLAAALSMVKIVKHQKMDVIDIDEYEG